MHALSPYITPVGKKRLETELDELWYRVRPEVVKALSAAAAEGDRSENAEYIYRKKQLREIDRRIRYLTKRCEEIVVVDRLPEDLSRVFFGASVAVENIDSGEQQVFRIVGIDEIDLERGFISVSSPVALALLRHKVGEEVVVNVPDGRREYVIAAIAYESLDP